MRRLLLTLVCLAGPGVAAAEGYYTPAPLLGEHASSLGGAFTAVADDPSAAWYNPAGLAHLPSSIFGANLDLYEVSRYERTDALQVRGKTADLETRLLTTVPSAFGVAWSVGGRHGVAVSVLVPEVERLSGGVAAEAAPAEREVASGALELETSDQTWLVGPSYGFRVTESLSLGASLFYELRQRRETVRRRSATASVGAEPGAVDSLALDLTDTRGSHGALTGVLGAMWSAGALRLGLSLQPPGLSLHDDLSLYVSRGLGAGPEAPDGLYLRQVFELGWTVRSPWRATLGASLALGDWLLAADLRGQAGGDAFDTVDPPETSGLAPRRIEPEATLNGNLGAEYRLAERYTLRAGAFTRFAGLAAPDGTDPNAPEVLDLVGAVLGLTRRSGATTLTIAAGYTHGWGQVPGLRLEAGPDGRPRLTGVVDDTRRQAIRLSTGGSYAF